MRGNMESQLMRSLSYGWVNRADIPGELKDYDVILVRETYKNMKEKLRLDFKPKMHVQDSLPFSISIDAVREPANSLYLLQTETNEENKVRAELNSKIKKKMNLSVKKKLLPKNDIIQGEEPPRDDDDQSDSDIPKKKVFKLRNYDRKEENQF